MVARGELLADDVRLAVCPRKRVVRVGPSGEAPLRIDLDMVAEYLVRREPRAVPRIAGGHDLVVEGPAHRVDGDAVRAQDGQQLGNFTRHREAEQHRHLDHAGASRIARGRAPAPALEADLAPLVDAPVHELRETVARHAVVEAFVPRVAEGGAVDARHAFPEEPHLRGEGSERLRAAHLLQRTHARHLQQFPVQVGAVEHDVPHRGVRVGGIERNVRIRDIREKNLLCFIGREGEGNLADDLVERAVPAVADRAGHVEVEHGVGVGIAGMALNRRLQRGMDGNVPRPLRQRRPRSRQGDCRQATRNAPHEAAPCCTHLKSQNGLHGAHYTKTPLTCGG